MAASEVDIYGVHVANIVTQQDFQRAQTVRDDLYHALSTRYTQTAVRDLNVVLRGSCVTGLGLRNAAVDIALSMRLTPRTSAYVRIPTSGFRIINFDEILFWVRDAAVSSSYFFELRINSLGNRPSKEDKPSLVLRHKRTRSYVLITLTVNGFDSILITQLQISYAALNPSLAPMIAFLKSWGREELLNPRRTKMTGFIVVLMVIFHQQRRAGMPAITLPVVGCTEAVISDLFASVGSIGPRKEASYIKEQLQDFLSFYSSFDFRKVIDIRTGEEDTEPSSNWRYHPMQITHPTRGTEGKNIADRMDLRSVRAFTEKMRASLDLFCTRGSSDNGQFPDNEANQRNPPNGPEETDNHEQDTRNTALKFNKDEAAKFKDVSDRQDEEDISESLIRLRRTRDEERLVNEESESQEDTEEGLDNGNSDSSQINAEVITRIDDTEESS